MTTVKNQIASALQASGLEKSDLREMRQSVAKPIIKTIRDRFTTTHTNRWWWQSLRENWPIFSCKLDMGWQKLEYVVPVKEEKVWFIVQESLHQEFLRLYIGKVAVIQKVIGECQGYEYYLAGCDFSWLVCRNTQDNIIAVGTEVAKNLEDLAQNQP